ncbi:MAG: Hsp20/alpha crystallin family protein [Treponema sp.]|jgi:hypothetical protein|nr:Hsp20/alpha crystallin family protein [Treponema sp.]
MYFVRLKTFCLLLFIVLIGCPVFEEIKTVNEIHVFLNGVEKTAFTIEQGETLTLRAEVPGFNPEDIVIVWEIEDNSRLAIVSSGEGAECTIRGIETYNDDIQITVKAWRRAGDIPADTTILVRVIDGEARKIIINGPAQLGVEEERFFTTRIFPDWANVPVNWTAYPNNIVAIKQPDENSSFIEGLTPGNVTITATAQAGGAFGTFELEVKATGIVNDLVILHDSEPAESSITIGLHEAINLGVSATLTPADAYVFFKWGSSNPANVSVDAEGRIMGLQADTYATITLSAGTVTRDILVTVKNPVTGLRIRYDNTENLPVTGIIWLFPDDELRLEATLGPAGIMGNVKWETEDDVIELTPDGRFCTIKWVEGSDFISPPIELWITAGNADNGERPVRTLVLVKTQPEHPIWAWERGRDGNLYNGTALVPSGTVLPGTSSTNPANTSPFTIKGRGVKESVPIAIGGNPIPYTEFGFKINSSNNFSGKNPDPVGPPPFASGNPNNSTRITIGTNSGYATQNATNANWSNIWNGQFDFLNHFFIRQDDNWVIKPEKENKMVRVSVDYEIIWTAGAGRNMWIHVNNNEANATRSLLGTASQLLINPLTAAMGSRETAIATWDLQDYVTSEIRGIETRGIRGHETLDKSFITIVALSNGGNIYVSGIRIEEFEE